MTVEAATSIVERTDDPGSLAELAKQHLLLHFTGPSAYQDAGPVIFTDGDGCWLTDSHGNRYLDALAGLFCVNIGYGYGDEVGQAVADQMTRLPYFTNWGYAQPPSIQLAATIARLAPEGLERVFFTSGGGDANEAAIKLVRQYHQARGEGSRHKFIARRVSYHGTSYGALSLNGMTNFRKDFEPLMPGTRHVSNTKRYRRPAGETEAEFTHLLLAELESLIIQEGPDTVAAMIIEPLQNAGGSLTPPAGYVDGVREICDRYGLLLIADEVICGFGRLGEWFGSQRYGIRPDIMTFAKGLSSAYAPIGGMIATTEVVDTVLNGPSRMYLHGLTFGGHPAACAAALANLRIMERDDVIGNVRRTEPHFRAALETLLDHPIVGDVRGDGYHYSLELVTDKAARTWSGDVAAGDLVASHLGPAMLKAGILCRVAVDHEGTPLIQFSPPLIMTADQIDYLVDRARAVLDEILPVTGVAP